LTLWIQSVGWNASGKGALVLRFGACLLAAGTPRAGIEGMADASHRYGRVSTDEQDRNGYSLDANAGVVNDDRGAALGEHARIGATEPTACTGYQRNLPDEIDHRTRP
jgi:hypothetical protein